jgi:hypothetical protein
LSKPSPIPNESTSSPPNPAVRVITLCLTSPDPYQDEWSLDTWLEEDIC